MTYDRLAELLPFLRDSSGNPKETLRSQYEAILPIAEGEVLAYIGYDFGDFEEQLEVPNKVAVLQHHPVIPESIEVISNGSNVDFIFDPKSSSLRFRQSPGSVDVYYSCGWYSSRPEIIDLAVARTIQHWAKFDNSAMVGVTSRTTDMGSEQIEQSDLPIIVKQSLARFRTEVIA